MSRAHQLARNERRTPRPHVEPASTPKKASAPKEPRQEPIAPKWPASALVDRIALRRFPGDDLREPTTPGGGFVPLTTRTLIDALQAEEVVLRVTCRTAAVVVAVIRAVGRDQDVMISVYSGEEQG